MKKVYLIIVFSLFAIQITDAQTYVSGNISSDTNWTNANSPYVITDDVTVLPNVSLTIEAGVTVKFDGQYVLKIVSGSIIINGTNSSNVIFTSNNNQPNVGDWESILFENGALGQISYALIQYATMGIHINDGSPVISDCMINNCINSIYVGGDYASPTIQRCTIENNDYCGIYCHGASLGDYTNISDCIIRNNRYGINNWLTNCNIKNCNINNNENGIISNHNSTINNCRVYYNNVGIVSSRKTVDITFCSVTGNSTGIQIGDNPQRTKINNCDLHSNDTYNVEYIGGSEDGEVDCTNNWWGTTDVNEIEDGIYDIYDDSNLNGWINYSPFQSSAVLSISYGTHMPDKFQLNQNYPNPFNPSTTITYGLENDSYVKVEIFDISGKLISTLQNNYQTQGWHSIVWNGTSQQGEPVPAGIYFSKLTSGDEIKTIKLMLLK